MLKAPYSQETRRILDANASPAAVMASKKANCEKRLV